MDAYRKGTREAAELDRTAGGFGPEVSTLLIYVHMSRTCRRGIFLLLLLLLLLLPFIRSHGHVGLVIN